MKKNILCFSENTELTKLFEYNFKKLSYEFSSYSHFETFTEECNPEAGKPSLIIINYSPNETNWFEFVHKIRIRFGLAAIPVLVISPFDFEIFQNDFELSGANAFILQPFGLQELFFTINYLTNNYEY